MQIYSRRSPSLLVFPFEVIKSLLEEMFIALYRHPLSKNWNKNYSILTYFEDHISRYNSDAKMVIPIIISFSASYIHFPKLLRGGIDWWRINHKLTDGLGEKSKSMKYFLLEILSILFINNTVSNIICRTVRQTVSQFLWVFLF